MPEADRRTNGSVCALGPPPERRRPSMSDPECGSLSAESGGSALPEEVQAPRTSGAHTRCAIYARVSTTEQSTAPQVEQLRAHATRLGWEVPESLVFTDDGISGVRDNRPALSLLRASMRRGLLDIVLATKLDRLGRSVIGVLSFFEECESVGVRVVIVDQGFDTSTPAGRLTRNVLAAIAEFERELIRERRESGVARARARGVRFGRRPIPTAPATLARIAQLRWSGESIRSIAQLVGLPRSRVDRLLRTVPKLPPPGKAPPL